ncbi:Adaptin ear-binding coat-associated protein 1 [Rhynchospora pubera]|uniref:Adaptin ear-binding coat-associated protein 1 n=1 Tax=Rhynchospora pubera TaxID=906938 RepID=A0AAV8C217_9POAL|nr:Adaptin ear-binding coat-associated protein 1 [Rhynchospora pubera]
MEKEKEDKGKKPEEENEESEALELVLFQVSECYVYLIPPRKSAASYRADEWDVNKWVWEGMLKVVSKGEECIIRLEDSKTGELYARAFLREGEPHPVEPVIDSSRYFVLRIEENIGGRQRHAFIGIGFRERPQAYDFQAALHDHMKYLNKKKTAEEMEQQYQNTSSVDYSLKEGETLVLQLKNKEGSRRAKSAFFEQGLNKLSLADQTTEGTKESPTLSLKLPPPPSLSHSLSLNSPRDCPDTNTSVHSTGEHSSQDTTEDDDFGDFQEAH